MIYGLIAKLLGKQQTINMTGVESLKWRGALDMNIHFLQENLLLTDVFYGYLIQMRVFTSETVEEIRDGVASTAARILKLVRYLKTRNDESFQKFLSILQKTEHRHVKQKLEQSIAEAKKNGLQTEMEELRELLEQKTKAIADLELEVSNWEQRCKEADKTAKSEMDRSEHYLEVIERLTTTSTETIDKQKHEIEEMEEEMTTLQDQLDTLGNNLKRTSQDLEKTKRQLNSAIEREKEVKKNLGLLEGASKQEVVARIQEIQGNKADFQKVIEDLDNIIEMKSTCNEKIRKLTQAMKKFEFDKSHKELQKERLRRNKNDDIILQNAKSLLNQPMKLPRINIGPGVTHDSRSTKQENIPANARGLNAQSSGQAPALSRDEPKYCVLCRKEYSVREICRIHTASIHDGKYPCCNAPASGQRCSTGCKTLNSHLYLHLTGGIGEFLFFDQKGRQLDFQEPDKQYQFLSER